MMMTPSRILITTFSVLIWFCSPAMGTDFDIRVVEATEGRSAIIADPGEAIAYEIRGRLTDLANEGLAGFAFDLAYEGGPLAVPVDPGDEMMSFVMPDGITNPAGYGGITVDGALAQIGGAQNTINNDVGDVLTGTVDTGIGHDEVILATGTVTAPTLQGVYRLVVSNLSATVIREGEMGPVWITEPAGVGTMANLSIGVGGIPTMSEWGTIVMTLLVLTIGTLVYMRRRPVSG